ncbi:hypothetical protein [Ruegeria arenilitoris]|uniref:hypothetical protein n=1 Tax=Ruegeria arenilitoris TaxID=1173585 RepID=UPI0020C3F5BD|nr:hypothetical protein [Ruegeria arenilitoris]
MTNDNTYSADIAAAPNSNLSESGELRATARDVTAEARAKGRFNTASAHIPTAEANNNPDIVARDGMASMQEGNSAAADSILPTSLIEMSLPFDRTFS